jgi:hypothetical protein
MKKKRECSERPELGHTSKYCPSGPPPRQKKRRLSSTQGEGSSAAHTSK